MRKVLILLTLSIFCGQIFAKSNKDRPKIVIGIVVDQMRADYLYQFEHKYGNDGLNQIKGAGTHFRNCYINYLPSYTGPGHASIYTGSVPAVHGIAGNNWYDRKNKKNMYCVYDGEQKNIGGLARNGMVSPTNMHTTTIADQVKLAQAGRSKTVAISLKDRGAVLPGGHSANAAYWMDDSLGHFMSSSYYMNILPNWVNTFNLAGKARSYLDKQWTPLYPKENYEYTQEQNHKYIGAHAGISNPVFPFSYGNQNAAYIKKTPYGNDIVFDFAKQAIENEGLGQGEYTDFLALSFSATDYIGHAFGPHSMEIEDTYLRFDMALGNFIKHLDATYGKANYLLFLTADHGALFNPNYLKDQKIKAGYMFDTKMVEDLNAYLLPKIKKSDAVVRINNNQVYLDRTLFISDNDWQKAKEEVVTYLKKRNEIQFCTTPENLYKAIIPAKIKELLTNSYNAERSGDIFFTLTPGYLDAYQYTGTSHGSWGAYDTKIPLIFYGWKVPKNKNVFTEVYMTDIAPTIASILNITPPNGCIGKALLPFDKK